MFEFILPDLGEGIHEGELIQWHVKENDTINEDEPLCDIETDKATVTIPSPRTGRIVQLNGSPGETLMVGSVVVVIDVGGSEAETSTSSDNKPAEPAPEKPVESVSEQPHRQKAIAAPATRKQAREMGIDINQVTGTGPAGRVTKEDLQRYSTAATESPDAIPKAIEKPSLEQDIPPSPVSSGTPTAIPFMEYQPLPDFSETGPVERVKITSLRRKTAVKTTTAMILVPHVAHMEECDVTELEALRQQYNQSHDPSDKLTLMAFIIKAMASLLTQYPVFNASLDPDRMEIILKHYVNIGFAADTPRGLMVPVIQNTNQLSVAAIGHQIRELAQKGREGTISLAELSRGTFTITNVGAIGGTGMVPTINYPESAILGLGRVTQKPVVKEDAIVIRKMLPMTLSFDHRVADGAQAARFINALKLMLEDPIHFMTGI